MPRKKLVEQLLEDNEAEVVVPAKEEVKPIDNGTITLKAWHQQFGGECIRTFTSKEDAEAWKKRFNATEIK